MVEDFWRDLGDAPSFLFHLSPSDIRLLSRVSSSIPLVSVLRGFYSIHSHYPVILQAILGVVAEENLLYSQLGHEVPVVELRFRFPPFSPHSLISLSNEKSLDTATLWLRTSR